MKNQTRPGPAGLDLIPVAQIPGGGRKRATSPGSSFSAPRRSNFPAKKASLAGRTSLPGFFQIALAILAAGFAVVDIGDMHTEQSHRNIRQGGLVGLQKGDALRQPFAVLHRAACRARRHNLPRMGSPAPGADPPKNRVPPGCWSWPALSRPWNHRRWHRPGGCACWMATLRIVGRVVGWGLLLAPVQPGQLRRW